MSKKATIWTSLALVLLAIIGFSYQALAPKQTDLSRQTVVNPNQTKPETNYYLHVNYKWLQETTIPDDEVAVSIDGQVSDKIDERIKKDLNALVSGEEKTDVEGIAALIDYYRLMTDFEERDRLGAEPIKPILEQLEAVSSLDDLAAKNKDLTLSALYQPVLLYPGQDQKDSSKKIMTLSAPPLFFDDTSYYEDQEELSYYQGEYAHYVSELLTMVGYDKAEAESLVWKAMAFDAMIAQFSPSAEELSDYDSTYNLRTADEVRAYSERFRLDRVANELVNQELTTFNVRTPYYFENFDIIVSEANFESIKAWMIVSEVTSDAPMLSDDIRVAADAFLDSSYGILPTSKEEAAFQQITKHFGEPLSLYYGKKYFSDEAKAQVIDMIEHIKAVYKKRLETNDWLSASTKEAAIRKLDKMDYYVGYDEEVSDEVAKVTIDKNQGYFENYYRIVKEQTADSFARFSEPHDKDDFVANSFDVNAYYDPLSNSMHFPTGYLQAPFFSEKQSLAENYGALGSVIGHEITHAFDSNGANFDEEGNQVDWWTESDKEAFATRAQTMVDFWDQLSYEGMQVNGSLSLTENIADASGLSVALEALQSVEPDADLKPFFESYAQTYRFKADPGYTRSLMSVDVHSPAELRVNISLQHLDAFYDTYQVKPGDEMFIPKKERIRIW